MSPHPPKTQKRTVQASLALLTAAAGLAGAVYALGASPPLRTEARPDAARPVHPGPAPALAISAQTPRRVVVPGAATGYLVRIIRGARLIRPRGPARWRLPERIWLRAVTPLPSGVRAAWLLRSTRASTATLTLRAAPGLRPGVYPVRLEARDRLSIDGRHPSHTAHAVVTLVVALPRRASFGITGDGLQMLAPGSSVPLDLRLANRQARVLKIARLTVRVAGVRAPVANTAHPCTVADFTVVQFSGAYGFRLAASSTRTLRALGVPASRLPRVAMTDRLVNQDGCKSASLTLAFTGSVSAETP